MYVCVCEAHRRATVRAWTYLLLLIESIDLLTDACLPVGTHLDLYID